MAPKIVSVKLPKPQKPKRAPTAYNIFMKNFMKNQCIASRDDAKNAIKAGAKAWGTMSGRQKEKFGKQATKFRVKRDKEMASYKLAMEAIKPPPRPFAAFCKDFYKGGEFQLPQQTDKRNLISLLGKSASAAWHKLQQNRRDDYSRQFRALYHSHKLKLSGGDQVVLNVQNIPQMTQLEQNHPQPSGPLASKVLSRQNVTMDNAQPGSALKHQSALNEHTTRKSARIANRKNDSRNSKPGGRVKQNRN